MRIKVVQTSRNLSGHAGLVALGHCLNHFAQLPAAIDPKLPVRAGIANSDVVRSYVGLLALGKSDFDAIENYRQDGFFRRSLGLRAVPSSATLRQRLDEVGRELQTITDELPVALLSRASAPVTALPMGHVPLDIDVFCMDNSGTRREGVSRTYAGYDGYAPIAAYLGAEGWCLGLELREGKHHSAMETDYTLERVLPRAAALTQQPVLVRMDSGFDSHRLIAQIVRHGAARKAAGGAAIDLLVKWNPRRNGAAKVIELAQGKEDLAWNEPREGKRVAVFSEPLVRVVDGNKYTHTRVYRVIERRIDKHGQRLLIPTWQVDGWETSLPVGEDGLRCEEVIGLYADHGTHEQFHSEFKTDLDLERLPSGKFDTNDAVLSLAVLAYNSLRLIGQHCLLGEDAPVRHPGKRRRLRTVMQEIMYLAVSIAEHARLMVLGLVHHASAYAAFRRLVEGWRIRLA